ncbi:RCC1 domain-containing protein [Stigmatella erecta]|nr:chromosome condensation regulator RCC1 [Stigmatella erecta]
MSSPYRLCSRPPVPLALLRASLLSSMGLLACGADAVAPRLQLHSPTAGWSYTSRRVRAEFTAVDDTQLSSLSWSLNGSDFQSLPLEAARDGTGFALEVAPRPGGNTLTVRVTDAAGNSAEQAVDFHFGSLSACGGPHTGVVRQGSLYLWGFNNRGQLGLGAEVTTNQGSPQRVPGIEGVAFLALNNNQSLALKEDGSVWAWGENTHGQLGLGTPAGPGQPWTPDFTPHPTPTRIEGLSGAVALSAGYHHSLVLMEDGTVRAFGDNSAGQLGDGTLEAIRDFPVAVSGLTDVVKVVAGNRHSVALKRDGTVWTWGRNTYGTLGQGTQDDQPHPTPTQVPGVADVVDIATGWEHVLALHAGGTLSSWGLNVSGQLGSGDALTGEQRHTPLPVKGLADARFVFASGNVSHARRADGTLVVWGENFNGQFGNGETAGTNVPVPLAERLQGVLTLSSSPVHAVAFLRDGTLWTWGLNISGSLGREGLRDRGLYPVPTQVPFP